MADYNLGTARGVIEIEYNGRGASQAQDDLKQTRTSAENAGPSLDDAGRKAGLAGLAIGAGFALAAKSAADFEARMSAVGAVSGASEGELERLRAKALQLGADTSFSAGESASAIEELVKAGLSVEDVLNGAADATVSLAAAGEVSMPEAASIASNAMNQFGLSAEDMVSVVDNIAGASNASAIDVSDFGQSLSQVGAVANLAGANFEDTATAIALMGNAGIKGSDAGTSLKTMLMNLQPTTEKQIALFKELGIVTEDGKNKFYDAQGNLKSLADVSGILQSSLKGMTAAQKQATLETMFGSDAIRAAAVLADQGAAGFDKMSASMNKVSAADVAAKRLDNFKGSFEALMGSVETLAITIGSMLLPALRKIVEALTSAANWFMSLNPAVQQGIVAFLGIVGASLLALAAFVKIVNFLKAVKLAFVAVRAAAIPAWLAALGPIALVIAAIAAVVAIVILLWKHSETFRDIVLAVWGAIKSGAQALASWFTGPFVNFFQAVWAAIRTGLNALKSFFTTIWNGIKAVVTVVISVIAGIIRTYIAIWSAIIRTGLKIVMAVWRGFWGLFGGVIKAAFALIVAIVRLGWTIIKGLFLLNLRLLRAVFGAAWHAMAAVVRAVWGVIRAVVTAGVNVARSVVTAAWNALKAVTSAVWNAISAVISAVWGRIGGTVTGAVDRVKSAISAAWDAVRDTTSRIWDAVVSLIKTAVGNIGDTVGDIKDTVVGALSGAANWLYDAGKAIIQGLLDGITSMIGAVTDKISSVTGTIADYLPGSPVEEGPLRKLNRGHAGKEIVSMLIDGISSMTDPLAATLNSSLAAPVLTPVASFAAPVPAAGASVSHGSRGMRLLSGTLRIDRSGRAFIRGVADEAVDDDHDFQGTVRSMG